MLQKRVVSHRSKDCTPHSKQVGKKPVREESENYKMTRSAHSKRMLSPTLLTRMVGRRGLLRAMSMAVVWLAMLVPMAGRSQDDNPKDHHGVQFAATGKDFWVCFPRSMRGESPNFSRLYAVCERDCDLTIENERLGYSLCSQSFQNNLSILPFLLRGYDYQAHQVVQ